MIGRKGWGIIYFRFVSIISFTRMETIINKGSNQINTDVVKPKH